VAKPAAHSASAPKPSAAKPVDSVAEAERYVYGRGVRQDCDRGLHMLKSAVARSDAKAMISLGALYSTGTCTPRDLPTAYRYFAGALHKQPENQALQDDLQKVWSQMTEPERQLAIKLSQ
jgi:TPR repeat protein